MSLDALAKAVPWFHYSTVKMEQREFWGDKLIAPVAYQDVEHLIYGVVNRMWGETNPTVMLVFGVPSGHWLRRAKTVFGHGVSTWAIYAPDRAMAVRAAFATLEAAPTQLRCPNEDCSTLIDLDWALERTSDGMLARCRQCGTLVSPQ